MTTPTSSVLRHGPVTDLLRRFRDLMVAQPEGVMSHHHPIWVEVAEALAQPAAQQSEAEYVTYHGGDPKVRFRDFKGNEPKWAQDIQPAHQPEPPVCDPSPLPVDGLIERLREIVSDDEVARVHGNANFGTMSPREVVNDGVRKYAVGYQGGHTQLCILMEHGLITKPRPGRYDASLTKKGRRYFRELQQSAADALEAAKAEIEGLRALSDPKHWRDRDDQWSDAVRAVHPTRSDDPKRHERFMTALEMVGNRHGKYELVGLVQWLLTRAERAEAEAADLRKTLEAERAWHDLQAEGLFETAREAAARKEPDESTLCARSVAHSARAQSIRQALAAHAKQEPGA